MISVALNACGEAPPTFSPALVSAIVSAVVSLLIFFGAKYLENLRERRRSKIVLNYLRKRLHSLVVVSSTESIRLTEFVKFAESQVEKTLVTKDVLSAIKLVETAEAYKNERDSRGYVSEVLCNGFAARLGQVTG
jgi:hypothetical protein